MKKNNKSTFKDCKPSTLQVDTLHCDQRKIVTIDDQGSPSIYKFHNDNNMTISVLAYDDVNKQTEGKQTDKLMLVCEKKYIFMVELKGSDFDKAVKQLLETFKRLEADFKDWCFFGRISLTHSRNIKANTTNEIRLKAYFAKHNNINPKEAKNNKSFFKHKNSIFEEKYSDLEKELSHFYE